MAGTVRKDKVQLDIEINGEPVKRSLGDMEKAYRKLRSEIKNLEVGSDAFNKKALEIKKVEDELKKTRAAARGLGEEQSKLSLTGGNTSKSLSQKFGSLPGIFGKAGSAIGGSITKLLGPLGLVVGAIGGVVAGAKELFVISQEFENAREEVSKFTDLTGEELSEVNAQIMAISRTFDQDFNEVMRTGSANANVFGSEMTESLDLIEKGLIATGHQGDEFLDQIKEYAPALKAAGLEQEEAYSVIASSIVDGAFQDKIPDAIKEFNIRIKDLSQGQRDVLEQSFGVGFTNNIVNGIKSGEKTSIEALNQIGSKLGELGADSAQTQAVISNLFGGPGEDVGAEFIIGLQNVKGSMEDVVDTSNIYIQRQIEQLSLEKELTAAQEEISMSLDGVSNWFGVVTKKVQIFVLQGIARASTSVRHFIDNFRIFRVQTVEAINVVLRAISNLVNNMIEAVNAINGLLGLKEIEDVDFQINVEVSSEDLKQQLKDKVAKEREEFEKAQELKAQQAARSREQASRKARLEERKKSLDAEKNLTTKELEKQAEVYAKAEAEIQKLQLALMKDGTEKQLAQLRFDIDQRKAALRGNTAQIAKQQELLEEEFLQKSIQIKKEASEKQKKELEKIENARIEKKKQQYETEIQLLEETYQKQQLIITQKAVTRLEDGDDQKEVQETLKKELLENEENFIQAKKQIEEKFGKDSVKTQQEIEKLKLDAALDRIDKEKHAEAAAAKEKTEQIQNTIGNVGDFINQISALNQAALDADLSKIEANKQRELQAAGNNEARKQQIEEKFAKQKEAEEKKAAKKQQAISIAQTIVNTAQSIVKTGATMGYPLAIPFQAIAAAIGAKQIQAIRAQAFEKGGDTVKTDGQNYFYQGQRLEKKGSFADGGHVVKGSLGVIGEKGREWVAPNWMVTNGKYAPIINELEQVRIRGFAVGGVTTPADAAVNVQSETISNEAIIEELKMLRQAVMDKSYITVWSEREALMNAEVYAAWQKRSNTGGI